MGTGWDYLKLRDRLSAVERAANYTNAVTSGAKGIFNILVAGIGIITICEMGPIDAARTMTKIAVGDAMNQRRELAQYCREGIALRYPGIQQTAIEDTLATYLHTPLVQGVVEAENVRIERLWDCTEEYAKSPWDRYFVPNIKGY